MLRKKESVPDDELTTDFRNSTSFGRSKTERGIRRNQWSSSLPPGTPSTGSESEVKAHAFSVSEKRKKAYGEKEEKEEKTISEGSVGVQRRLRRKRRKKE